MKRILIALTVTLGLCSTFKAQVKIGNNPTTINTGSLLELESTNKGLLPTRIALSDRLTWAPMAGTPVKGMIVFNTTIGGGNGLDTGLVIWEGQWNDFLTAAKSKPWPYHTNDLSVGAAGNAKGIIALPGAGQLATGNYSHAEGLKDTATADYAWAIGMDNKVAGQYGFASGSNNKINAGVSNVILAGKDNSINSASGGYNLVSGINNKIDTKNGSANIVYSRNSVIGFPGASSAGTASENQNLIIGADDTIYHKGTADASRNIIAGTGNKVIGGSRNLLLGGGMYIDSSSGNITSGQDHYIVESATNNIVIGTRDTVRNTQGSVALGGFNFIDSATYSSSLGYRLRNNSWVSAVVGTGNAWKPSAKKYGPWEPTDPQFTVGAGEPGVVGGTLEDTVNAFMVLKNGWTLVNAGLKKTSASNPYFSPRAELDVTGTGAMIIPTGTNGQKPSVPVVGMTRFNSTYGCMEVYDGSAWHGTINKSESVTLPAIASNAGYTYTFTTFSSAPTGSAVVISPDQTALANGLVIAWGGVSAGGNVVLRIQNGSGGFAGGTYNMQVRIMY